MRIGLLSDTHGLLDEDLLKALEGCDEIWHAGDIGSEQVADTLESLAPVVAVYGNIDGHLLRLRYPEVQSFSRDGLSILMTHIAGYPGRYNAVVKKLIADHRPGLVICGHSHILKVMRDTALGHLHMNPGAAGHHGFHAVRTLLRFSLLNGKVTALEAVELGRRGRVI
jgi:putative phosphoesterase